MIGSGPRLASGLLGRTALVGLLWAAAGCQDMRAYRPPALGNPLDARADDEFAAGELRPPTAKTLYAMAVMLGAEGRDAEGEFMLARIVQEYPGFFPAYNELAELYVRRRRIDDAIRTLNAGLTACPRAPILLNNLGMCRMLRSEYSQAAAAFQAAAAAAPQDVRFRANLAAALGMLGRYEEGLALYEQVLPESEAHFNLGILCRARQDEARAAREFQRAKDLGYSEENRSVPAASGGR